SRTFSDAYQDFCARIERDEPVPIDAYAAENPAEFFAVLSEAFFETPSAVQSTFPEVYQQLALFYRQHPAERIARPAVNAVPAATS
ncbi:MAG TPA: zinc-dependent peptidase, partial [Burkholderiales bacterium]|nr:zinc-dependent peptidase [Burkholderiales bacterium]